MDHKEPSIISALHISKPLFPWYTSVSYLLQKYGGRGGIYPPIWVTRSNCTCYRQWHMLQWSGPNQLMARSSDNRLRRMSESTRLKILISVKTCCIQHKTATSSPYSVPIYNMYVITKLITNICSKGPTCTQYEIILAIEGNIFCQKLHITYVIYTFVSQTLL